jgi:hypothetical protein
MILEGRKLLLSASNNGRNILIGTSSTLIHLVPEDVTPTFEPGTTERLIHEIYLGIINNGIEDQEVTLYWGGTEEEDTEMVIIPFRQGIYNVRAGHILTGGLEVRALSSQPVLVTGWVHELREITE